VGVGIESLNVYPGRACLPVPLLFEARGLDAKRIGNLMMREKSVNLPCEDPVTNAVNAAKPLIDAMTPNERECIELVVVGTESGIDFGKPISTYVHDRLGLAPSCRSFEIKHACYGGTAALQTAAALIAQGPLPDAKALVIAADATLRPDRHSYWEPSQGAGAVAMTVGRDPAILELDPGANGYHSYEVMDTLRPRADIEAGDSDRSLMSYLECLEHSYRMYATRVAGVDWFQTFDYLVFHTPFAGMVKGAHRRLTGKLTGASPEAIDADFARRVEPSLEFPARQGNTYSAALYVALCSLIVRAAPSEPVRVGMFSYGSGCASEFYSGTLPRGAHARLVALGTAAAIDDRYVLEMDEYELVSDLSIERICGVRDHVFDPAAYGAIYDVCLQGRGLLVLDRISEYHREYRWS
jgi:polyketide biosynthesis 3-hydroxy-3-methylglutaryl-CoA synthase-like enzyme PksG